jgi:tetratricopeptide (TPR) repeat protein
VTRKLRERVPAGSSPVAAFSAWQWSELAAPLQQLLVVCTAAERLPLELLMVAIDQGASFVPGRRLLELVGDSSLSMAEALTTWERRGFLRRMTSWRVLEPDRRPFLSQRRGELVHGELAETALALSQCICEGLRRLGKHLLAQPNPALLHHLLAHRQQLAQHLEALWFGEDFVGFMAAKQVLDQLLRQARLADESADWARSLLRRSKTPSPDASATPSASLGWLTLALQALTGPDADAVVEGGAATWQRWLDARPEPIEPRHAPCFRLATTFLDQLYRKQGKLEAALAINERARRVYLRAEAWPAAIESLKALALCHTELGQPEQALGCEQVILDEVPYAKAPAGFEAQQLLDVALARAGRGALDAAQAVVDRLVPLEGATRHGEVIEALQADLHYQRGDYLQALDAYSKVWVRMARRQPQTASQPLQQRLSVIRDQLGAEAFTLRLDAALPTDVPRPSLGAP